MLQCRKRRHTCPMNGLNDDPQVFRLSFPVHVQPMPKDRKIEHFQSQGGRNYGNTTLPTDQTVLPEYLIGVEHATFEPSCS
ncbi:hypothetical protein J6590_002812 [Homalodisca vitripennis]|nr:hypothetical protein J6590_002812 [Homalodisca vitripennis]